MDIVKIRQDSQYLWTLQLYNHKYNNNKLIIYFNYIDNLIHNYFIKYDFYNETYTFFQILNLLRVLQYVKEIRIREYLINSLKTLL